MEHLSLKTMMNIAEFIITPFAVIEAWDGVLPVRLSTVNSEDKTDYRTSTGHSCAGSHTNGGVAVDSLWDSPSHSIVCPSTVFRRLSFLFSVSEGERVERCVSFFSFHDYACCYLFPQVLFIQFVHASLFCLYSNFWPYRTF